MIFKLKFAQVKDGRVFVNVNDVIELQEAFERFAKSISLVMDVLNFRKEDITINNYPSLNFNIEDITLLFSICDILIFNWEAVKKLIAFIFLFLLSTCIECYIYALMLTVGILCFQIFKE